MRRISALSRLRYKTLYSRDSGKLKLFDIRDRWQMPRKTITRLNRGLSLENADVSPCGKHFAYGADQKGPDWSLPDLIHSCSQVFDQFFIEQIFIVLDAAAVLHAHGQTDIQTATRAASALRPLAGEAAFLLFSIGIIGTGLMAIPALAGSAAYALAEAFKWPIGLQKKLDKAWGFYGHLVRGHAAGRCVGFHIDQSNQSTVLECRDQCKADRNSEASNAAKNGWTATAIMFGVAAGMITTWGR
jgi:hypothetical protein